MKIVIAPDSFKGSLTAKEVADCIEFGIKKIKPDSEIIKIPMADGGEGTVQSLVDCTKGKLIKLKVNNPLFEKIEATYGILGDSKTAVIEMAEASGLPLLKREQKNPLITSTYGTGELIKHALDSGCRNFIIGLGGSATNDGGAGIVQCLGGKLLDENGDDVKPGGGSLSKIKTIDLSNFDNRIAECNITVACDVDNPLIGPNGASHVFGPQKGANKEMVKQLDKNLEHYANVINNTLNIDIKNIPGAGAAGGLGGGLLAFFGAELKRGIDIVINTVELESYIKDADLVFTGEGMMDFQTQFGKTPFGVAKVASKYNVPVIGIAGTLGKDIDILYQKGFTSLFSITDKPMSLDDAIKNSRELVSNVSERIIRLF
ncbi:glycerate kinase [Clostridium sp. DL1XJH146]